MDWIRDVPLTFTSLLCGTWQEKFSMSFLHTGLCEAECGRSCLPDAPLQLLHVPAEQVGQTHEGQERGQSSRIMQRI